MPPVAAGTRPHRRTPPRRRPVCWRTDGASLTFSNRRQPRVGQVPLLGTVLESFTMSDCWAPRRGVDTIESEIDAMSDDAGRGPEIDVVALRRRLDSLRAATDVP